MVDLVKEKARAAGIGDIRAVTSAAKGMRQTIGFACDLVRFPA
ncbi:MAG TPA: hypothetical protein VN714_06135 [Trebonia sp.]|nr:hypothetical protein [Trebonia sp.]